jgi:acyl dehydratase
MPLNRDFIGKRYPPSPPYEVAREKIRDFAVAIGDRNPVYFDAAAAKELGYPDVIAPPTFLTTVSMRFGGEGPVTDPALGMNYLLVVHGEQRYVHERPLHAGDVVTIASWVEDIRDAGRNELMTVGSEVRTLDGELVSTMYSTIVSRGTAEPKEEAQ